MIQASHSKKNRDLGFTLIEVLISVTLLAFLSIFTARAIHQGFTQKSKIQKNIDKSSQLRAALSVISRDIQLAFNYRDQNIALFNIAQKERKIRYEASLKKPKTDPKTDPKKDPATTDPKTSATTDDKNNTNPNSTKTKTFDLKKEVIVTAFVGTEDSLNFTSLSHVRTQANAQESDQAEVGYFVRGCRNRINSKLKSDCLWRRLSYVIDDEIEKGGQETVILENVTKLQFKFLGPGHEEEWISAWKSKDSLDAATKNNFPYAVEITIETENKNVKGSRPLAMTVVASIRFPNNPRKDDPAVTPQGGTADGATPAPPAAGSTSGVAP